MFIDTDRNKVIVISSILSNNQILGHDIVIYNLSRLSDQIDHQNYQFTYQIIEGNSLVEEVIDKEDQIIS